MNKAILLGRLVKEPELRYTTSGTAVATFTLAVDRRFQKQGEERQADFIKCIVFNKTAEFVANYFAKGQMMALSGSIQTRTWEDNEGKKRYETEVIADEVYFAESKKSSENATPKAPAQPKADFEEVDGNNDDLPF